MNANSSINTTTAAIAELLATLTSASQAIEENHELRCDLNYADLQLRGVKKELAAAYEELEEANRLRLAAERHVEALFEYNRKLEKDLEQMTASRDEARANDHRHIEEAIVAEDKLERINEILNPGMMRQAILPPPPPPVCVFYEDPSWLQSV